MRVLAEAPRGCLGDLQRTNRQTTAVVRQDARGGRPIAAKTLDVSDHLMRAVATLWRWM